ncbi:DNA ligase [Photobacterium malacitanum]|uniref:DNA ligase n=1 Tax=Photobacterium malacitanum TaxID=2204294 RepID=A0A1Y6MC84_9GAMM|nr:DNA ligase [Photobacterium malacitanum]SMY34112.1 DNA ligase [Photobacterium malacitanum]
MTSLPFQPCNNHYNVHNFQCIGKRLTSIAALVSLSLSFPVTAEQVSLMLAKSLPSDQLNAVHYSDDAQIHDNFTIADYLVSEKLDGIRAYWNGSQLLTKTGNIIHAPNWFYANFPSIPLDGELWIERGQFQALTRIVLDSSPNHEAWQRVNYMVFDLPHNTAPFEQRYRQLQALIDQQRDHNHRPIKHLQWVEHKSLDNLAILMQWLDIVSSHDGEGLMLHHKSNNYTAGRTEHLLKLKNHQDAEAIIIGYEEGNGKYQGMMGAVWVKTSTNDTFKIGSGFNDQQRQSPPAIGSTIQYRYNGYTDRGIPRFARFVRIRHTPDS